jgi:hypothetical protein
VVALLGLAVAVPTADGDTVRKPKRGATFTGAPGKVELLVGADGLDLVGFSVRCGKTTARTSLNAVALKRTARGYTFAFRGRAGFTYADTESGANGSVQLEGRFSATARSARGTVRAKLARCGSTRLEWTARRASR